METSAGDDKDLRRWRVTLTIGAWLLIVQSGSGVLFGLLSLTLVSGFSPDSMLSQLGPMVGSVDTSSISRLLSQATMLNWIGIAANTVLLAGSIGLLLRHKWGWYAVVVLHLAETVAAVVWGSGMLKPVVAMLDPGRANSLSLVMALLIALIPGSIVAILLLKPITRQFEPAASGAAGSPKL
jgi:hypothetical protein